MFSRFSNRSFPRATAFALCFSALALTGCGGGGSSGPETSAYANVSVPLRTAQANYVNNGFTVNFDVSGWIGNSSSVVTGSGTLTQSPAVSGTFNSSSALVVNMSTSATVTVLGVTNTINTSGTAYVDPSSYAELASTSAGSIYTEYPAFTYPLTAVPGNSGTLYSNAPIYSDNTKAVQVGKQTETYSVAADSATTVLVTVVDDEYDMNGAHTTQTRQVLRISTTGAVTPVSLTQTDYGNLPSNLVYTFR